MSVLNQNFLPALVPPSPSDCIASFETVCFQKNKEFLDALNDCQLLKEASKLFPYGDVSNCCAHVRAAMLELIVRANNPAFVPPSDKLSLVTAALCSRDEFPEAHIIKMNCFLGTKNMFIDVNV